MPTGEINSCDACGDARRSCGGGRLETLPYGTVRSAAGELIIGVESLAHVTATQRTLFEQAVAATCVDPDDVLVVRITEVGVHVAAIDVDDERWPVRTVHVAARACLLAPPADAMSAARARVTGSFRLVGEAQTA